MSLNISNLYSVKGKKALITGGGSGLGEMMATALVHNGAHVYIASRKEKQLKEVAERLTKDGPGKCEYIIADVSAKAGCVALIEEVKKRTDVLHILVNNTGTTWGDKFGTEFDEEKGWKRVFGTNVYALFYITAGLTPLLEKEATATDPGRVVNISSVAGFDRKVEGTGLSDAGVGLWSYNTSKSAANALTQQLAVTLGSRKISVNAINPGVYPSKMTAFGFQQDKDNSLAKSHPMGRVGGPEDMAGLLLFLVSRAGSHVSGNCIMTDGGALLAQRGYSHI